MKGSKRRKHSATTKGGVGAICQDDLKRVGVKQVSVRLSIGPERGELTLLDGLQQADPTDLFAGGREHADEVFEDGSLRMHSGNDVRAPRENHHATIWEHLEVVVGAMKGEFVDSMKDVYMEKMDGARQQAALFKTHFKMTLVIVCAASAKQQVLAPLKNTLTKNKIILNR